MIKVLLISGEYPPYMFGGGATFMYHLSRGLMKRGIEATVIAHKLTNSFSNNIEVEHVDKKLKIVWVPVLVFAYPHHETFQLLARYVISKLITHHDIIHMNTGLYYPWLRNMIKQSDKPAVVTIHGDPIVVNKVVLGHPTVPYREKLYGVLHMYEAYQALKKEVNELYPVFVSKSSYESLKHVFNIKRHSVIHNGVDFEFLREAANSFPQTQFYGMLRAAKEHGFKILVYPARFHPIKNHVSLLPLLHYLLKETKPLLVLTSEGSLRNLIMQKATKLGLSDYIVFTGKLPYDETIRLISLSDIVVFPSLYEAHPISIIEALYLGKPVIAFDLPYIKELREACKKINTAKNLTEFIEKTLEILSSKEFTNYSFYESECLLQKFSNESMVGHYVKLYEDVMSHV